MTFATADLKTLSGLLDEALDLAPEHVPAWLDALPEACQHLLPTLREMLAEHLSETQAGFLSGSPGLAADTSDDSVAQAGDRVGPYQLIREIGRGGMGTVWLAERADGSLKRQIALKLPRLAWGAGLAERMARERDIGALLEHPSIARLYDAGVDVLGRPYLALEYIDGQPLDAWCELQGLGVRERLRLFVQVARAVAYAHGRLVVHRDLKPSNVLVTTDGQVRLLDFGIAKLLLDGVADDEGLTRESGRVLTPHFASPEQLLGETITVASDVYSLGVLLYELLTGRLPHAPERQSLAALEEAILNDEPAPASSRAQDKAVARQLHGELDAILGKALQRDPSQRYATADALAEDIQRHLNGERVLARPDSLGYRLTKALKRHRLGFGAGGAVLVAVLVGAGVALVQARRANDAAERARVVKEFVIDVFKVNERGNPGNAELRQLPAELLLEHGAKLIETRFAGQPALQAELYGVVGGIFADMGANPLAATYASRQIDALAAIGASASDRARAVMLLAEALFAQRRLAEAHLQASHALALAEPNAELRPKALVLLARVMRKQGQNAEAMAMLDRAEQDMTRTRAGPSAAGAGAKAVRAAVLSDLNRFDEALPIYNSAIDEALAAEGALSSVAIDIRFSLAAALLARGRTPESRPYRDAALAALRASGAAGDMRAALEESTSHALMFEMDEIPFAEARAAVEQSRASLAARGSGVPNAIRASVDFNLGTLYLDWGDIAHAEPLIANDAAFLRQATESPSERLGIASFEGTLAMYAGRHAQADHFYRERLELRKQGGQMNHPFAAYDYAFIALNLVMQDRFGEAEDLLASSPVFQTVKGGGAAAQEYGKIIQRGLARTRLERGNATEALAALPPDDEDADEKFPFDGRMLRGEVLCAAERRAEGLALLDTALKNHAEKDYAHHPDLARARAVAGLCALAGGQRARAAELARLAQASFVAQPAVSPYFKRPAERLTALLAQAPPPAPNER